VEIHSHVDLNFQFKEELELGKDTQFQSVHVAMIGVRECIILGMQKIFAQI